MTPRVPFTVIPWQSGFLPQLLRLALEETDGDIGSASFLFPHNRPIRYLTLLLHRNRAVRKPLLLPRMTTVSSLFALLAGRISARPAWNAGLLDRVGLLLQCVREETGRARANATSRAGSRPEEGPNLADPERFFPWGVRLASLYEECFSQCRRPRDFIHLEGQVSPYARALLERLGGIFSHYESGLEERGWTTPGYDAFRVAAYVKANEALPPGLPFGGGPVYIAGFYALTGSEDALFRHLWEHGGRVVLHADAQTALGAGHWSCRALEDWAHSWGTRMDLAAPEAGSPNPTGAEHAAPRQFGPKAAYGEPSARTPTFRYVAGYDLHSQLAALRDELDPPPGLVPPGPSGTEPDALPGASPGGCSRASSGDSSSNSSGNTLGDSSSNSLGTASFAMSGAPSGGGAADPSDSASDSADGAASERNASVPGGPAHGTDGTDGDDRARDDLTEAFGAGQAPALPDEDRLADTAVILPDSGLLLPVLHHLPRTDINISMGYPLARSPLFRLVDTLLRLQERRRGSGYYWRDLVELLRHPYIKMLRAEADAAGEEPRNAPPEPGAFAKAEDTLAGREALRRELHMLERALRQRGGKFIEPRSFITDEYIQREQEAMPDASVLGFLEKLLATCLDAFDEPRTPARLAACLEGVCELLLTHGGHLWRHFPIDAECMYRLRHSLIPELARYALADEPLERETLFALLRNLMEAERVPFEADPLVGMQVMGMLESRLLTFRRVIVADAVESSLPGSPQGDPLLPEPLRPELGLPSLRSREQVTAYHFFRLVHSAEEVVLLWREGVTPGTIAESSGGKSRFIEELLWEEEKRRGSLFAANRDDPPLRVIPARVAPIARERRALRVTPQIHRLLVGVRDGPVSASLLDAYLACPLSFFYERAARLVPAEEVAEGEDPLAVGNIMHLLLHDVYKDLVGKQLPGNESLESMLGEELAAAFALSPELAHLGRIIPADSFTMLTTAGSQRLADYLRSQPPTMPLALEHAFSANFSFPMRPGPMRHSLTQCGLMEPDPARGSMQPDPMQGPMHPNPMQSNSMQSNSMQSNSMQSSTVFTVRLTGKADRIDLRCGLPSGKARMPETYRVILDYKTGHVPRIDNKIWDRDALWTALDGWEPATPDTSPGNAQAIDPVFSSLAERFESVQLPFYLLLHRLALEQGSLPEGSSAIGTAGNAPALDARWVALGDKGREVSLFPDALPLEKRWEIITDRVPRLIRFLLRHIALTPMLIPRPGKRCNWCPSAKLCMVVPASAELPRG